MLSPNPLIVALLLIAVPAPEQFWPATIAGWIALVSAILALLATVFGGLWTYFRFVSQVNGVGERVTALEKWRDEEDGRQMEKTLAYERMANAQEGLLQEIGRAKAAADGCGADTERLADRIEAQIREFRQEWNDAERKAEGRFARLEERVEMILRTSPRP